MTFESTRTDFILSDDLIIEDINPSVWLLNTDDDKAFGLHYHQGEVYEIGFWEGTDSGSGVSLTRGVPLWGYDSSRVRYDYEAHAEIAGRVRQNNIKHIAISCDPGAWYDSDAEIFIMTIGDDAPSGIIIDEWKTSCNVDPDVEVAATLNYADAWIGLANAVTIDTLTTTTGTSSEDTDANINGGAPIPNGKVMYILFTSDPEGTAVQWIVDIWYHLS